MGFVPSKSAFKYGITSKLGTFENVGYVYIKIRRQPNETSMPEFVQGNLTAQISYSSQSSKGLGKVEIYVNQLESSEDYLSRYGFWNNRASISTSGITKDSVSIAVHDSNSAKFAQFNLKKGESSSDISIPGIDICAASMKLKVDDITVPTTRARLAVDEDTVELTKGTSFLEGACKVEQITKRGLSQNVRISCKEDDGKVKSTTLGIQPKAVIKIDGQTPSGCKDDGTDNDEDCQIGDLLGTAEVGVRKYNIFLGYIGQDKSGNFVIVPFLSTATTESQFLSLETYSRAVSYVDAVVNDNGFISNSFADLGELAKKVVDTINHLLKRDSTTPIAVYFIGENSFSSSLGTNVGEGIPKVSFERLSGSKNGDLSNQDLVKSNYQKAKIDYEFILTNYPSEKESDSTRTIAEEAFVKYLALANSLNQKADLARLCEEFKDEFSLLNEYSEFCEGVQVYNTQSNTASFMIKEQLRTISLNEIFEPSVQDYSAEIALSSLTEKTSQDFVLIKDYPAQLSSSKEYIYLKELNEEYAIFDITGVERSGLSKIFTRTVKVNLGETSQVFGTNDYQIKVSKINLNRAAKISVIPQFSKSSSEAEFSFKIGIEKRAIQLSPEKTQEIIDNMNESIEKLTGYSEGLGKVVKGLKTACFASQTILSVKNLLELGPAGMARQMVMKGEEGWYSRCEVMMKDEPGKYVSSEDCLLKNSDKIDSEVEYVSSVVKKQNDDINSLEEGAISQEASFWQGTIIDTDKFVESYIPEVQRDLEETSYIEYASLLTVPNWENKIVTIDELKEIQLYSRIINENSNPEQVKLAKSRLNSLLGSIETRKKEYDSASAAQAKVNEIDSSIKIINNYVSSSKSVEGKYSGGIVSSNKIEGLSSEEGKPFELVNYNRANYLVILEAIIGYENTYQSKDVYRYTVSNGKIQASVIIDSTLKTKILDSFSYFKKYTSSSYSNKYTNPVLRYYETEPYKGLPAIVPFDLTNGWYVATKQTLATGSNLASYDESGRPSSFYLCNVAKNGLEEFFSTNFGGDICQVINLNTGQPYNEFTGLTNSEATELVKKAVRALQTAQGAYKSGVSEVKIEGNKIKVGSPAADLPNIQCQDFMSPKECNLIFNLCDPVICPSSRCDFGGAYPVKDVIQTGVIGSIMLCLPNAREGIVMPVCLTGVQAGLDSWISVEKSYMSCLQESLDSGKTVGICDQIRSVYLCEFLWEQAAPLAEVALPKLTQSILGENSRGGGEYSYSSDLLDRAQDSYEYFTSSYSANSLEAFNIRSSQEIGGEICKNFGSMVFPTSAEALNQVATTLVEPDSPTQYHARFDEIPFTTATVPPTSQYKVFYHIFAGNDAGVYYSVYLKGAESSSFYQDASTPKKIVSGFIPKGEYATETKDFTAVSGYKQLCISINNEEECGFKQVSTSFAADYLTDKYLEEQITQTEIKTQAECISGKASLGSLLSLNPQAALSEAVDPEIYNMNVIRICATANPGSKSDVNMGKENQKWVEVGYCDDTALKCWLDTEGIKEMLNSPDLAKYLSEGKTESLSESVLEEVQENYLDILREQSNTTFLPEQEVETKIQEIKSMSFDKAITTIKTLLEQTFFNRQKALLLFLKGNLYAEEAIKNYRPDSQEGLDNLRQEPEEISYPSESDSQDIYSQNQESFDSSSSNPPSGFSEIEFKSLLIAVSELENKGITSEFIEQLSSKLRSFLGDSNDETYKMCSRRKNSLRCVLSVYKTNKIDSDGILFQSKWTGRNVEGIDYAEEVIALSGKWEDYFNDISSK
ncbi:MAG TPA: hypothetical protein PLK34_00310 [Candidatus Pacearchaeota archaeon]|nr:hypothetical protein [Candidatus Pacearchaeota archaeon]